MLLATPPGSTAQLWEGVGVGSQACQRVVQQWQQQGGQRCILQTCAVASMPPTVG